MPHTTTTLLRQCSNSAYGVQVRMRAYQKEIVQTMVRTDREYPHRLLCVAPTGSGKTILAIVTGVALLCSNKIERVHVVAPKSVVPQFQAQVDQLVPLDWQGHFNVYPHSQYFKPHSPLREGLSRTLLVIDEAHAFVTRVIYVRQKNPRENLRGSRGSRRSVSSQKITSGQMSHYAVQSARRARGLLLLTATPLQNSPLDLQNLLCMVRGETLRMYNESPWGESVRKRLLIQQRQYLRTGNTAIARDIYHTPLMSQYVHTMAPLMTIVTATADNLPEVTDKIVPLIMDASYLRAYEAIEQKQIGIFLKHLRRINQSIKKHKPNARSRKEHEKQSTDLSPLQCVFQPDSIDAFYHKLRIAVNGCTTKIVSPKVNYAVNIAAKGHHTRRRVLIYSAFLAGGLSLIKYQLKRVCSPPIPFVQIDGAASSDARNAAVCALNTGKVYVLLLSRAGSEGLDLKGVRDVVLLEPHFHSERHDQVIGRAVRYQSHVMLPPSERTVNVHRLRLRKPHDDGHTWEAVEQHNTAQVKRLLSEQRIRAEQRTLGLQMNPRVFSFYQNVREDVWQTLQDDLQASSTSKTLGLYDTLKDPLHKVRVDTSTVLDNDENIYVMFLDQELEELDFLDFESRSTTSSRSRSRSLSRSSGSRSRTSGYRSRTSSSRTSGSRTSSSRTSGSRTSGSRTSGSRTSHFRSHTSRFRSHTSGSRSLSYSHNNVVYHMQYSLRRPPKRTSVDDIISRMADRKSELNRIHLNTLRQHIPRRARIAAE